MQLFLKILSGMANSVDSDQTAPSEAIRLLLQEQSDLGSALFLYVILSDTMGRTFTVTMILAKLVQGVEPYSTLHTNKK